MEQRTDEWFFARLGKVTASKIKSVMARIKSGEAAERRNYRADLVVERLTGKKVEGFTNAAMTWGNEAEPLARQAYEAHAGVLVEEVGFLDHPDIEMTGASPDGIIGVDGMLEIKCPNTATHIDWLLAGVVPSEHKDQMLWQMECAGRSWCDFVSYDPRLPAHLALFVIRFERDDTRLNEIREEVKKFLSEVDNTIQSLERIAA